MNEVLKQRLVGALILVALGVIFWPIIFVEPGSRAIESQKVIPPQPGLSAEPVAAPERIGLRPPEPVQIVPADVEAADADDPTSEAAALVRKEDAGSVATGTVKPVRRDAAPEPLAVDQQGIPEAWILQVASVSSQEKAEVLQSGLLALDHKAYVKRVSANGKTLYRVYIGPNFERAVLEKARPAVDAEFGVSSMIRRYVP